MTDIKQDKDSPPVLTDKEILKLFTDEIFPKYKKEIDSVEFPRLAILAGPPGSGKSTIYEIVKKEFGLKCRPLHIDYDQLCLEYPFMSIIYSEKYHKDMPLYTADAATIWKRMMLDKGIEENANVVYEHPLHKKEFIEGVIRKYKTANYGIDLHCVVVNSKQSIQGIFRRYVMAEATKPYTGRTVIPLDIHDKAYAAYPQTAQYLEDEKLVDTIAVYNRKDRLFENTLKGGVWEKPQKIGSIIKNERDRIWSQEEKDAHVATWDKVEATWQEHMKGKTPDPDEYFNDALPFIEEARAFAEAVQATSEHLEHAGVVVRLSPHHVFVQTEKEFVSFDKNPMEVHEFEVGDAWILRSKPVSHLVGGRLRLNKDL